MDGGVKSVTVTTLDVGGSGDLAHEVGTVLLTLQAEGRPPATASAKFVVVWKRKQTAGRSTATSGTIPAGLDDRSVGAVRKSH